MEPRKSLSCCFVSASIYFLSHNWALKMSISGISQTRRLLPVWGKILATDFISENAFS